jgi:hypothetical protein
MSSKRTATHPISAREARKNVAVEAPRASLFAIDAFVSLHPNRRMSSGEHVSRIVGFALNRKPSVDFSGYWHVAPRPPPGVAFAPEIPR